MADHSGMPIDGDPTTAEANQAWGHQLQERGQLADAAHAFETASLLDPLNPELYFDHAAVVVEMAEAQSPYFRDRLWARAQALVERGGELDQQNRRGAALYERILQARVYDQATTTDTAPMEMLDKGSTPPMHIREIVETEPLPLSSKARRRGARYFINGKKLPYAAAHFAVISFVVVYIVLLYAIPEMVTPRSLLVLGATAVGLWLITRTVFGRLRSRRANRLNW